VRSLIWFVRSRCAHLRAAKPPEESYQQSQPHSHHHQLFSSSSIMSGSPMQESGLVPPRDHLANTSCVRVTQDGAGADAKVPGDSVDERAADAADRGRQPEDKAPAAPRSVIVRGGSSSGSGTADDALKRLVELTEGGDRPNLHELNFGVRSAPFVGSRRWQNKIIENSDCEGQSKIYDESHQWTEDTITCFSDLGFFFDIGITSQEPQERLKTKPYDHPNRVDQRMFGLLKVGSKELAQSVEKILQNWARIKNLPGFSNDPDAAGSGRLNEGPQTIYLVYWRENRNPPESPDDTFPLDTQSEGEESADEYVPTAYHQKRARAAPERPGRQKRRSCVAQSEESGDDEMDESEQEPEIESALTPLPAALSSPPDAPPSPPAPPTPPVPPRQRAGAGALLDTPARPRFRYVHPPWKAGHFWTTSVMIEGSNITAGCHRTREGAARAVDTMLLSYGKPAVNFPGEAAAVLTSPHLAGERLAALCQGWKDQFNARVAAGENATRAAFPPIGARPPITLEFLAGASRRPPRARRGRARPTTGTVSYTA
jgi:hypothetical protein